jgi:hypothetical protein
MESLLSVSSPQKWKHLDDFNDAPRPSVNKKKWDGAVYGALLVNEVDAEGIESLNRDLGFEGGSWLSRASATRQSYVLS